MTFNQDTIDDLVYHSTRDGRQFYGAVIIPYSGVFSDKDTGSHVDPPKIVCPYQVNDIIAIQERWAKSSKSYVYATGIEEEDEGYHFRPAYTMPMDAVRLHARIVSIKPWRITKGMIDYYLTRGMIPENSPGSSKVIGYYNSGNRLLSKIRNRHNRLILSKSSQPLVPAVPPMVIKNVPYYLREPVTYYLRYIPDSEYDQEDPSLIVRQGPTTSKAQAYNDKTNIVKVPEGAPISDVTLDYFYGDWTWTAMTQYQAYEYMEKSGKGLINRGVYYYSPPGGPTQYVYLYLDSNGRPIPRYKYYTTEVVNPDKHWFAWMISGYLSDKEGNIIGDWF